MMGEFTVCMPWHDACRRCTCSFSAQLGDISSGSRSVHLSQKASAHPAIAPLAKEIFCHQGCNLSALSHSWPISKEEASAVPIGQKVLMAGTGRMHCTRLQAGDALCTSNEGISRLRQLTQAGYCEDQMRSHIYGVVL